jgi:hypothetical protein
MFSRSQYVFFQVKIRTGICYLDVNWLILKISACRAYFESCDFSRENTNAMYSCIRVYVWFKDDKHVIWMWIWLILKNINSFASLTRQQTSYSGSVGWYFDWLCIFNMTCRKVLYFCKTNQWNLPTQ